MFEQAVILHVRPGSAPYGGVSQTLSDRMDRPVLTASSPEGALEVIATTDVGAVVCDHAPDSGLDGLAVLEAVRGDHLELPVLLCTGEPDGRVAAEATRLDVTEYAPRSEVEPADRVRALVREDSAPALVGTRERELERNNESLQRLTELASAESHTDEEIIERVLELGADRLDLSLGYLSRIDGSDYEVVSVVGDHDIIEAGTEADLSDTYCRRIVEDDRDHFGVTDAVAEGWDDDRAYQLSGIACYLGGKVVVDGELYGTLCFADDEPRSESFSESEQAFTQLLAEWTSRELERRQRNAALEQYETVIEAVDDGIYALDETGHFQLVNDAMTELTGYEASELLGAHTSHIKSDEVVERAESIVRSMIFGERDDDEETFDLEIVRADGTTFPAEDHMTLVWDQDGEWFEGTAGIIRDITERKERERRLREANRRIEQILGRIGAAFFAVDDDWTLTYWNHRAEEVLGKSSDEVMGEQLWEMFPEAVEATFYDAYHEAMETQEPVAFEEYYPPVGKWFRVNAYPSENGLSVYFHDLTEQKERDQKLSGLLETTRSLMQAHTAEAVAETVVAAAESELGFDLNLVRLYDEERESLEPVAATDGMPDRPVYDADEAFPGEAYQRGETVRVDDFGEVRTYDDRGAKAAMYVPLDDHGVLSVATYDKEHFSDADVSVAEILASNAAAALDRVEREQDLLRYETVIENVRDMVYVLDEAGRFQLVTEALADWLGYGRAELTGRHPRAVLDDESVEAFARQIRDLHDAGGGGTIRMETTLYTADGEERPVEIEVSLIDEAGFRGTAGVVRDRTELEQTREELRDERDRFSYLFNNLPDAVVETEFTDDAPLVRSVNPAFTDVFGLDRRTVLDDELNEYILPPGDDARDEAERLDRQGAEGETVQAEIRRRTADGFRDFLFRGVPYRRDDGRVWSFGIYTDITEQKERERRLEVLNRVLRHNLRNDLTVVLGLADELHERTDDETHRDLLSRLLRKAEQIASLSDRAREIERSVRRDDADTTPIDVAEVADSVATRYAREYEASVDISVPESAVMAADGRLGRVVGELVENSLEHAGAAPAVSVDVEPTPETVSVTVADDGPGIPDHELDVLTGNEPITQLSHGSGLGLWLVIWVVESYGGTVRFENTAEGASVRLTLARTDI
jgi:PAS domain S-box-containing protein